jgi:molybdopterin synthase catalytic subunit
VVSLMESSVVAAVSAPHRPEAFEAARFAIDAVKASAPIWKHETWADGADWGTAAHALVNPGSVATAQSSGDRA